MYGKEPTVAPIREARFKGKGQSNGLKAGTESVCYCYSQTYDSKPARRSQRAGFEIMSLGKYSVSCELLRGVAEWSGGRSFEENLPFVTMPGSG